MIYLDSAATTFQKPAAVQRAVVRAMRTMSSPGRGGYAAAQQADELLFRCRSAAAELFSVPSSEQVVFTMNATHGLNIAIKSLVRPCGRVVVSGYEHNAVTRPLTALKAKVSVAGGPLFDQEAAIRAFDELIVPGVDVVICNHVSNVFGFVQPVEKVAALCRSRGVPLIVDNTFPTPVNCRPFEWGADIVTHSTTKYMDGHGAVLGGAIVDGGKFDWMAHAEKFPGLCTPDDSYHGITYAERFGKEGAFITKATAQLMRDFGCVQSPINAYMLNLGLESLHVRMARHCENGQAVAEFLASHPKIAYVNYCGLPGDKYHAVAEKYLPNGSCGVVSFGVKGGREAAAAFMGHLKIAAIETHVADARTCCLHPASSTHRQMNDEQLIAAGVQPDLVRMSCGLEDKNDLIHDIAQALDQI